MQSSVCNVYQHIKLQTCLPTPPPCQPLTQGNNDAKSLVYSRQPWPCCVRLPTYGCKSGKGRAGFCLYFSERVLPGRHVCQLAIMTFMWPVTNQCMSHVYMCVWLSLWGSTSLQKVPQNSQPLEDHSKVAGSLFIFSLIPYTSLSPRCLWEPVVSLQACPLNLFLH